MINWIKNLTMTNGTNSKRIWKACQGVWERYLCDMLSLFSEQRGGKGSPAGHACKSMERTSSFPGWQFHAYMELMITEYITLPICVLALFGVYRAIGISIWERKDVSDHCVSIAGMSLGNMVRIWMAETWPVDGYTFQRKVYYYMGAISGIWLIIAFIVILIIYKKAQRTNDEMIRQLGGYDATE